MSYICEHFRDPDGVLVVDETDFLKKGTHSAGIDSDAVYGDNRHLRLWLEDKQKAYVFAVSSKEYVPIGFAQCRIKEYLEDLSEDGWVRMSAGDGSKGLRFYDWLLIELNPPEHEGWSRGLLVRRSVGEPQEIKAHVVYAPSTTRISEMVRVAGMRWAIEVSFEEAKQQTGLDEYEVRSFTGWYRHITPSMFAYALLGLLKKGTKEDVKKNLVLRTGSLARFKAGRGLQSR